MGFTIKELKNLLNAEIYSEIETEINVKNFEYSTQQFSEHKVSGLCFIAISEKRWSESHGKKLTWMEGNDSALKFAHLYDVLITEAPIEQLKKTKIQLIVKNSYDVLNILAKASRKKMTNPVIAITGSVGKSSTRLMLEQLLDEKVKVVATRGNHNTQAGVPLYCSKLCTNPDVGILEISLNALNNRGNQSLVVQPDVVIVTSIGEAHLSTLHTTENIAEYKARIFAGMQTDGLAIINMDISDKEKGILIQAAQKKTKNIKFYSMISQNADIYLDQINHEKDYTLVKCVYKGKDLTFRLNMPSNGMVENILATILCLGELGYHVTTYMNKIEHVRSLNRIMEVKSITTKDHRKVTLIDDSHNAAIPSMINAIDTFNAKAEFYKGEKILVLGQVADLGDKSVLLHKKLQGYIEKSKATIIIGHGEYMRDIIRALPTERVGGWFTSAKTMSNFIPYLCKDDSLVLFKGSVSGGDFQLTSLFLPRMLASSQRTFDIQSKKEMINCLQPMFGLLMMERETNKIVYESGYTHSQSIEGLGPILLFYLLINKGIKKNNREPLKKWPTNLMKSSNPKAYTEGMVFSDEELVKELLSNQHPSGIFELASRYFQTTKKAMVHIEEIRDKLELPKETSLNLTGRYRVKEQQRFNLTHMKIIATNLENYVTELPKLSLFENANLRGIIFGQLKKSIIVFSDKHVVCATGYDDLDKLKKAFAPIIVHGKRKGLEQ